MVDPALGVVVGWNHFVSSSGGSGAQQLLIDIQFAQTSYVIFEATVINTLVEYWGYDQSPAILITSMDLHIKFGI
jgi:yeast amino acid transporter